MYNVGSIHKMYEVRSESRQTGTSRPMEVPKTISGLLWVKKWVSCLHILVEGTQSVNWPVELSRSFLPFRDRNVFQRSGYLPLSGVRSNSVYFTMPILRLPPLSLPPIRTRDKRIHQFLLKVPSPTTWDLDLLNDIRYTSRPPFSSIPSTAPGPCYTLL